MNDAASKLKTPPSAPGLPILGNAMDLVRDPLAFFAQMYEKLGPVFRAGGPGRSYVVLAGPEANRRFRTWEDHYMSSGPVYKPYVDDLNTENVLIAMDGEEHRAYRKWLRPAFSREAIKTYVPHMVQAIERYIESWEPGDKVGFTEAMQFLIAQLSGTALMGCPVDGHFKDARVFAHTFLGAGVGSFPGFMRGFPGYRRSRRRFLDFLRDIISGHLDESSNGRSTILLDRLLEGNPLGKPLTESDLLATAHMPYTNSLVYVAATCGFMLYELLKHPEILEQVMLELDVLFLNGPPELSTLQRTRWLRGALLETQRLHPISLSLPRYVHRDFEFEGYLIQAGSMTLTATAVTHFMPEYFPDPYRFDVSRYWAPRQEHRQVGVLVPYGFGPHVCLSAGVVNSLALLTVGTLLRHFELALEPSDYELGISVAPFPAPARNFRVRVEKRRGSEPIRAHGLPEFPIEVEELLAEIDSGPLVKAVSQAEKRRFGPGAVIVQEGDHSDALYIIASGEVEVLKTGLDGQQVVVAHRGVGEYFGEIGLLESIPRTATVRAINDVETIVLDQETFIALVTETDMTSEEIAAVMHRRLICATLAISLPKLSLDQAAEISPHFELASFETGETIIRQGDPADKFYIIVRGQVEVVNEHPDGREISLAFRGEGDFFGEIGLLQSRPRNATVRADDDDRVLVMTLERDHFLALMADSDDTSEQIALRMVERLTDEIS